MACFGRFDRKKTVNSQEGGPLAKDTQYVDGRIKMTFLMEGMENTPGCFIWGLSVGQDQLEQA